VLKQCKMAARISIVAAWALGVAMHVLAWQEVPGSEGAAAASTASGPARGASVTLHAKWSAPSYAMEAAELLVSAWDMAIWAAYGGTQGVNDLHTFSAT
jgi:hypothetical protein